MRMRIRRFVNKRLAVATIVVAVLVAAGGVAFAFFPSTGSGTGAAQVGGAPSGLLINQDGGTPIYNSTSAGAAYQWSQAFVAATGLNALGNDVTLSGANEQLSKVVVAMGNFSPASDSVAIPITLNIYNPGSGEPGNGITPGSLIATDTVSVTPPGTATGYTGPGTTGIDNFEVTFDFTGQYVFLPQKVVYGITYDDATVDTGLNVNYSYEPPSVGTDTYPGYLFASTESGGNADVGGPNGQITCQDVSSTFAQYSTAAGNDDNCGLGATPGGNLVPAVEFDASSLAPNQEPVLYPGGTQPVNFTVTNPGSTSAQVQTVTIAVASDGTDVETTPGDASTAVSGCLASWFTINGSPVAVNENVNPGGTIDVSGKASITMINEPVDQSACENVDVGLTFASD